MALAAGLPAAWIVKDRYPIRPVSFIEWRLFRDFTFLMVFFAGAVATFALFIPAFFLPLYTHSLGLPSSTGAALLAGFNFSTAIGRLASSVLCDFYRAAEHDLHCYACKCYDYVVDMAGLGHAGASGRVSDYQWHRKRVIIYQYPNSDGHPAWPS